MDRESFLVGPTVQDRCENRATFAEVAMKSRVIVRRASVLDTLCDEAFSRLIKKRRRRAATAAAGCERALESVVDVIEVID